MKSRWPVRVQPPTCRAVPPHPRALAACAAQAGSAPRTSESPATSDVEASLRLIDQKDQPRGFDFGHKVTSGSEATFRKAATIATDGIRPAVQVERGTVGVKVQFDIEAGGDQHIQVLTREGVHVAGTAALTNAQANNLMSLDSGFGAGGYSNTYLNQVGGASYLDTAIEFGTRANTYVPFGL